MSARPRIWQPSRRALLGGLALVGAQAFLPRKSASAEVAAAKRFIVIHVPEGMWGDAARPQAGAASLGAIFSPLDPFRSKLSVLNGLNLRSRDQGPGGDGHHRGVPHMLTCTEMADEGNAGGASVDQKIAQAIGASNTFKSLQFAVRIVYGDTNSSMVWAAARERLPTMENPWEAYTRIFGNVKLDGDAPPPLDLRTSAIDHALAEINTLRGKMPTADRVRLDSYHDSLRDIERRLAGMPAGGSCVLPTMGATFDARSDALYPETGKLQMDLMVAALRCDLTRVASLQWGNSNDQCSYPWLGINKLGHDLAHSNMSDAKQTVFHWYAEQFAYLLGQLEAVSEGEGTMLDNTIVLWVSEFGESDGHSSDNLLWLLMGNAAGYLKQGQTLNLKGRSVNDLHATITGAFGIPDKTFGNPAYCDGVLTDLLA